jgi:hypothetical protein
MQTPPYCAEVKNSEATPRLPDAFSWLSSDNFLTNFYVIRMKSRLQRGRSSMLIRLPTSAALHDLSVWLRNPGSLLDIIATKIFTKFK